MILYSIVPSEIVLKDIDKGNQVILKEVEYMGEKIIVAPLQNNQYEIKRLISTSPRAFLDPKFQPGNIIRGNF